MTQRQFNESLKKGEIHSHYVLLGYEPILIDRAVNTIKEMVKVEESFDLDRFSLPDTAIADIAARLYLMPINSKQRLLVVRNLEEVTEGELQDFADLAKRNKSGNCLVLSYQMKKGFKSYKNVLKKLTAIFPEAEVVLIMPERNEIRRWIQSKIRRDALNLNSAMVDYLEEEFGNDITGLKNEFEKIENYLHEVGSIDPANMKDLAKGLCDYDRYQVVNTLLDGRREALHKYEELQPYLPSNAVLVDAFTRGVVSRARGKGKSIQVSKTALQDVLGQLIGIDKKIKTGSIFTRLSMELFILHNAGTFRNGASYGR
jgi:DNA polymerase III delta subunit